MSSAAFKTPISYYGGKQTLLRHIMPLIPPHRVYTEAFAGGAAVFFAKDPSEVEVINDINGNLVNFYKVLQSNYPELKVKIDQTLHSREDHVFAQMVYDFPKYFNPVTRAWALWVLSKQSFASRLDGTWGYDKQKNTVSKKIQNAKESFSQDLARRLERTQIECTDALRIIRTRDSRDTFHFVDPPYINTDCGHYSSYNQEDFSNLLNLLASIKGRFMLTMFPIQILDEMVTVMGWKKVIVQRFISASKTSRRKQDELIVMNYQL